MFKDKPKINKNLLNILAISGTVITLASVPLMIGCNGQETRIVENINQQQQNYKIEEESDIIKYIDSETFKISGYLDDITVNENKRQCDISIYNIIEENIFYENHRASFHFPNICSGYVASFSDAKKNLGLDNLVVDLYIKNNKWTGTGIYPSENNDKEQGIKKILVLRDGMDRDKQSFSFIGYNLENNMIEVLTSFDEQKINIFNSELTPGIEIIAYTKFHDKNGTMWNELLSYEKLTDVNS